MIVSGVPKLRSEVWRSGNALIDLMSTTHFGNKKLYDSLNQHNNLSRILCWLVIIIECIFWIVFVSGGYAIFILIIGITFHGIIAMVMGLNKFFFAFISPYPAIWLCSQILSNTVL